MRLRAARAFELEPGGTIQCTTAISVMTFNPIWMAPIHLHRVPSTPLVVGSLMLDTYFVTVERFIPSVDPVVTGAYVCTPHHPFAVPRPPPALASFCLCRFFSPSYSSFLLSSLSVGFSPGPWELSILLQPHSSFSCRPGPSFTWCPSLRPWPLHGPSYLPLVLQDRYRYPPCLRASPRPPHHPKSTAQ